MSDNEPLPQDEVAKLCCETTEELRVPTEDDYRHPFDINRGYCDDWAKLLIDKLGGERKDKLGPQLLWDHEVPREWFTPAHTVWQHCFVRYSDRYYDAEMPHGVTSPDQLPFYMRQLLEDPKWRNAAYAAVVDLYERERADVFRNGGAGGVSRLQENN